MITNRKHLSMAEASDLLKKSKADEELIGFLKNFTKLSEKDALEMKKKLEELDNMKVRPEHIVKVIDLLPESQEELNKIFVNVSLNEDESTKILDTVKQFK